MAPVNVLDRPPKSLSSPPPSHDSHVLLSYPVPHVLLVTFNRPKAMNSISEALRRDLVAVFAWFETEPDLWVVAITGNGPAFCAGADLKGWKASNQSGPSRDVQSALDAEGGFGALSRRVSTKTIIAAVNGLCLGGGLEIVVNCDIVVASEKASFGFPEPSVGVVAAQGAIPRMVRLAGHQRASEMLLTGERVSAAEARDKFGFVNAVVSPDSVLPTALSYAQKITSLSPDSVRATKKGINDASHVAGGIEDAWREGLVSKESWAVYDGENIAEGLKAFSERRKPKWVNPKAKL